MATFWRGTVTTTNGSNQITVQSGDDIALIRERSLLQVESTQVVEVLRTYMAGSVPTIELVNNWGGSSQSGRSAIAAPTAGELAAASERLRQLGDQVTTLLSEYGDVADTANSAVQPGDSFTVLSGVGTAAGATVTTTGSSTTAGNLVKVGDYGLGRGRVSMTADLNTVTTPGTYFVSSSGSTNLPPLSVFYILEVTTGTSSSVNDRCRQVATASAGISTIRRFERTLTGSGWTAWVEVWNSATFDPSSKTDLTNTNRVSVPASATSTGVVGQWAADASHLYTCVATNTWRRVAHSAW